MKPSSPLIPYIGNAMSARDPAAHNHLSLPPQGALVVSQPDSFDSLCPTGLPGEKRFATDVQHAPSYEDFEPVIFDDSSLYQDSGYYSSEAGLGDQPRSTEHHSSWEDCNVNCLQPAFSPASTSHIHPSHHHSAYLNPCISICMPVSPMSLKTVSSLSRKSSSSSLGLWGPQVPEPSTGRCADARQHSSRASVNDEFDTLNCPRLISDSTNHERAAFKLPLPKSSSPSLSRVSPTSQSEIHSFSGLQYEPPALDNGSPRFSTSRKLSSNPPSQLVRLDQNLPEVLPENLFDDNDPWNTIGRLLKIERQTENQSSTVETRTSTSRQLTNYLRSLMTPDRSGVGYVASHDYVDSSSKSMTYIAPHKGLSISCDIPGTKVEEISEMQEDFDTMSYEGLSEEHCSISQVETSLPGFAFNAVQFSTLNDTFSDGGNYPSSSNIMYSVVKNRPQVRDTNILTSSIDDVNHGSTNVVSHFADTPFQSDLVNCHDSLPYNEFLDAIDHPEPRSWTTKSESPLTHNTPNHSPKEPEANRCLSGSRTLIFQGPCLFTDDSEESDECGS